MRCDTSKGKSCAKLVAGAVLLSLASAASAVTTLVGGGSTLPSVGYTGASSVALTIPGTSTPPLTPTAGSLFGVYASGTGNAVTYCPTGSGAGKKILAGNDSANFQVNLGCSATVLKPLGFGGVGLVQPHFTASDAPLSMSELNAYQSPLGHGSSAQPVQFPAIGGAIAIVYKKVGVNSMTLTEGQICGIFSGQIRDWSSLIPGTSGPINVVYRRDSSGTSYSFLNHLSAVCPSNVAPGVSTAAVNFTTNQAWAGAFNPSGNPLGAQAYVPAYASVIPAYGAIGNKGVTDAVNLTDGSIGYAEAATAITTPVRLAFVRNSHSNVAVNPATGFGSTPMAVNIIFDRVVADSTTIAGWNGATLSGRPVMNPLSTTNQCIAIVDPNDYADPSTGYPILAVSYLLANAQGNGSDAAPLRGLLFSPYNKTTRPSVTKIGRINTGLVWLSNAQLDSNNPTSGMQARINSCVN